MATDASFVDYVCDQAGLGARLTSKRLFGEYALYVDGKVVAYSSVNDVGRVVNPTIVRGQLDGGAVQGL